MRYKQFRTLTEADLKKLDELRMNPTTLQQFATSPAAEGIRAGFEAELVFTGLGGSGDDDYDMEPDYDADERCRSIQGVIEFFENDDYGYGLSSRAANQLQEKLDERYYEWQDEQMYEAFRDEADDLVREKIEDEFDKEDFIREWLLDQYGRDEMLAAFEAANEAPRFTSTAQQQEYIKQYPAYEAYMTAEAAADQDLDDQVERSISNHDEYYDEALDDFRDGFSLDDDSGFFSEIGLNYMSDIAEEFRLDWPVMTGTGSSEGGYSESNAEMLADSLSKEIGVKTKVSSGYHSAKRDDVTWIFEPDSSLEANDDNDMPVEIISPPMPLLACLDKMEQFFTWATQNGAYANSSTGFHMGVSLPVRGGDVDYVKLALFLGDEHVLESFGRSSNHFCEAAMKKIKKRVKGNPEAVAGALDLMRHNLIELAQKALEINNQGFGKYTSINPQGGSDSTRIENRRGAKYIEFRSAGGVDEHGDMYFEDIKKLQNTLMRYAQAMYVASEPSVERKEYYKKLYKLISPPEGDPAIDLFARFATGAISSEELKKTWAEKQLGNEPKGDWKLWDESGKAVPGEEFHGYSKSDAWEKAWKSISPGSTLGGFKTAYKLLPLKSQTGDWEVYRVDDGKTLETLHGFATKGEAADSVYDKYSKEGIAFNLRPADPEAPEKPLTQREKLAKNIKAAPAEEIKNWKVYDTKTGEVHYEQEGRKSNLVQAMRKMEKENKWPQGRLAIEEIPMEEKGNWDVIYKPTGRVIDSILSVDSKEAQQLLSNVARQHDFNNVDDLELRAQATKDKNSADDVPRTWQYINNTTGQVIASHPNLTLAQAEETKRRYQDRYDVSMRTVPTDASAERVAQRTPQQDNSQLLDRPPEGFLTQRPATGDYYEVRGGNDRVYGYISSDAGRAPGGMGLARTARQYVNNLTGTTGSYIQYRAGDPVQATAPNGVPLWIVYELDSGNVVHTFADHDVTSAWATAQSWLRGIGAEDPSLFSVRPKLTATQQNESRLVSMYEKMLDAMITPVGRLVK